MCSRAVDGALSHSNVSTAPLAAEKLQWSAAFHTSDLASHQGAAAAAPPPIKSELAAAARIAPRRRQPHARRFSPRAIYFPHPGPRSPRENLLSVSFFGGSRRSDCLFAVGGRLGGGLRLTKRGTHSTYEGAHTYHRAKRIEDVI